MHGYRIVGSAMLSLALLAMASVAMKSSEARAAGGFLEELDGYQLAQSGQGNTAAGFARPDVQVLETDTLAELRGGFSINGLDLAFGARLQSMIDDVLYQTVVEFTASGPDVLSHTLVDPTGNAMGIDPASGGSLVNISPEGMSLPGLEQFSGVAVNDAKGFSAVLHHVTDQAMIGGVVSNASERSIGNQMNLDVTINNMEALRNLGIQSRIANAVSR